MTTEANYLARAYYPIPRGTAVQAALMPLVAALSIDITPDLQACVTEAQTAFSANAAMTEAQGHVETLRRREANARQRLDLDRFQRERREAEYAAVLRGGADDELEVRRAAVLSGPGESDMLARELETISRLREESEATFIAVGGRERAKFRTELIQQFVASHAAKLDSLVTLLDRPDVRQLLVEITADAETYVRLWNNQIHFH